MRHELLISTVEDKQVPITQVLFLQALKRMQVAIGRHSRPQAEQGADSPDPDEQPDETDNQSPKTFRMY